MGLGGWPNGDRLCRKRHLDWLGVDDCFIMLKQSGDQPRREASMLIDVRSRLRSPIQQRLYGLFEGIIEDGLGIARFERAYELAREGFVNDPRGRVAGAWFDAALDGLGVTPVVQAPEKLEIPVSGPLVVVCNHPFGIVDPCVVASFVAKHRSDVKVMTNGFMERIPEVRPFIIPVDPFGGEDSRRDNVRSMRACLDHLKRGGTLIVFPAGEVASYKPGQGVEEAPWHAHIASLVRRTGAAVLPVCFPGHNSRLFHLAGLVHPRLRTGLLLRECAAAEGRTVPMHVGQMLPFSRLKKFRSDEELIQFLRLRTLILQRRKSGGPQVQETASPLPGGPVFAIDEHRLIADEVERLRTKGRRLVGQGSLSVFHAKSDEIPSALREIGRLREETFRAVGEGTGEEMDLDAYDSYYTHVFLWDEAEARIAGAYRLGRADEILREKGKRGLYTHTLFKFRKPFLDRLSDAVEMGRSFIRKEYQRHLASLPLLWKGIAHWMARHPHYRQLFGPVSISQDYDLLSRALMVEYLQANCLHTELASYVKPRRPFRYHRGSRLLREFISARLQDADECSALISSLETDQKGIPVLLKHYLRLNGTILSFNVDKAFSSVVDGLILVDLTQTDPRLLARYMGEERCADYLAHHGITRGGR